MNLEKFIKDKLSNHEFEYSEQAWDKMEKLLNKQASSISPINIFSGAAVKYFIIGLSSVAIIGTSIWFLNDNNTETLPNIEKINTSESNSASFTEDNTDLKLYDLKTEESILNNKNIEPKAERIAYTEIAANYNLQIDVNDLLLNNLIETEEPLVEDEELPIKAVFGDNYEDYYFIPNPNIKVYDLPEPTNKTKFEGQHTDVKDKRPMQKPKKKVFEKKKRTLRELLGL
jgi:hypothetical protein